LKDNLTIEVLEISDSGYPIMHSMESPLGNGIAEVLTKNRGIKTVIASQNEMYSSGATAIGAALATNRSLTTLDLGYKAIDSDGAKAVFDGLRKNKKTALGKLDLSRCEMDARSAKSLGKLLKQNTSLKEIIVGHMNDPEGSRHIASGLLANKSGCIVHFVNS
jgi:Ran GTPase-activating protein (RanGAP) involved in mRNA processing and transport